MNKLLEQTFERIRALPPEDQARAKAALEDILDDADNGLSGTDYRAYVEAALKDVETDYDAGRHIPASAAFDQVISKLKQKHGI